MQNALVTKARILDEAGYFYNFEREIYVNRKTKKAFSVDFIEDRDEEEIQKCIRQLPDGGWHFYFISDPSEAVRRELESVLG